jgi:hypothetical protein
MVLMEGFASGSLSYFTSNNEHIDLVTVRIKIMNYRKRTSIASLDVKLHTDIINFSVSMLST